jgi:hypothetical protein
MLSKCSTTKLYPQLDSILKAKVFHLCYLNRIKGVGFFFLSHILDFLMAIFLGWGLNKNLKLCKRRGT